MEFIDKLAEKVSEGTKALSKRTEELLEVTELKMEMKELEEEIIDIKIFMGEMVYKNYLGNSIDPAELTGRCKEIEEIYKKIHLIKKQVNNVKGIYNCHHCGEEIEITINYCPRCGAKIRN